MRLFIDPAHGGPEKGYCLNGLVEADLVLEIALDLQHAILERRFPVEVGMSRNRKLTPRIHLAERGKLAAQFGADCVLALRANACQDSSPHGLRTFYFPQDDHARAIALAIEMRQPPALEHPSPPPMETRGAWPFAHNILSFHRRSPAVLVHVGFLSNPGDVAALSTSEVRRQLTECLLAGVERAIGLFGAEKSKAQ